MIDDQRKICNVHVVHGGCRVSEYSIEVEQCQRSRALCDANSHILHQLNDVLMWWSTDSKRSARICVYSLCRNFNDISASRLCRKNYQFWSITPEISRTCEQLEKPRLLRLTLHCCLVRLLHCAIHIWWWRTSHVLPSFALSSFSQCSGMDKVITLKSADCLAGPF